MQNYINQLIEDIHKASWNVRSPHEVWDYADPDYEVELEEVSFLLEHNRLKLAVNRIYYGMFYIVSALAAKYSFA